jgi:hypothetical protein
MDPAVAVSAGAVPLDPERAAAVQQLPRASASDDDLAVLPRAGLQVHLAAVRDALRAAFAWLATWATRLIASARKAGANAVPAARKLGASVAPVAQKVREKLPAASELRTGAAAFAGRLRARIPSASVLNAETRPRWFLPVVAVAGLIVGIGLMGIIVGLLSKGGDESTGREPGARPKPSATTSAVAAVAASAPPVESAPGAPALVACTVVGSPHVIAPRATLGAGLEVVRLGEDVALGFAPTDKEAMAVRLDPSSLTATATARARSAEGISRATPIVNAKGTLALAIDADKRVDRLRGRRTVSTDPPIQLGAGEGALEWAPLRQPPGGQLWTLEGGEDVEALRGAVDRSGDPEVAVAFRRAGAVWMGVAEGTTSLAPKGELSRIDGLGIAVGSPAVAMSGGAVVVAWADRSSSDEPWHLRWARFKAGTAPRPATFAPPPGGKGDQAMSPGLTALSGGRFLLVWTEGPQSGHEVRAQTLSPEGTPLGPPLVASAEGSNAGAGQAATNGNGQGVIAFLQSRADGFEVAASAIDCGP